MTEDQRQLLMVGLQGDGCIAQVAEWNGEPRLVPAVAEECVAAGWLDYLGLREPVEAGETWSSVPPLHVWKITDEGRKAMAQ